MNTLAGVLIATAGAAVAQVLTTDDPMQRKAQEFVLLIANGRVDEISPYMDETMNRAFPPASARATWAGVEQQAGEFQRILGVFDVQDPSYRIVGVLCEFAREKVNVRVVFNKENLIGGFFLQPPGDTNAIEPPYANKDLFDEIETNVVSDGVSLPGTLTIPKGEGPFPVAVFVHGSGPNDRDETIGPNKPFRDLAWGLATLGVASLRYEKRTRVAPQSLDMATLTYREETVDDAIAALAMVAADARFDADRVVVIGHSFGATLAPLIAKESDTVDGVVMMAATTERLMDAISRQMEYIFRQDGALNEMEEGQLQAIRDAAEQIEAGDTSPSILGGVGKRYLDAMDAYDGPAIAKALAVPIFVAQGARDYQVLAETSYKDWQAALADKPNATLKLYPALDHLFIAGTGPSYPRDYQRAQNVSEEFVRDVSEWIKALD